MLQRSNYKFTNWAGNERCVAQNYYQPETEAELISLIGLNSKIRMVGTGHSWSSVCLTDDTLINLDKYNKVVHLDREENTVKVQAGIKLWQLNHFLDKNGFALSNLGSICEQSVAGAISTGTHGSGITYSILGAQVDEFTLIKADGEKCIINAQSDKELFCISLVNLGCLGVISEITLRIVPAFNLHEYTIALPYEEVLDSLEELIHSNHHFKLWWFPHTDKMVVYRYNRTEHSVNDSRLRQWLMDEVISVRVYRLLLQLGTLHRNRRVGINNLLVKNFIKPLERIEKSYKVFNVPAPPVHRETEWAFDVAVAHDLLRDYKRMIDASSHRINFIQEIRFTKADNFALSPCYKRNSMWLGVYNADNYGWNELLTDFEKLAIRYNGRPHWGKEFTVGKNYLDESYPLKKGFENLRLQFDPDEKFANAYIHRLFGQTL